MTAQVMHAPLVVFVRRADTRDFGRLAPNGDWQRLDYAEHQPIAVLDDALQQQPPPAAVILDASIAQPLSLARRIQRAAPLAQLVFVCDEQSDPTFRQLMRLSPLMGAHWVVLLRSDRRFDELVREQVRLGERRLRHRTSLNRANARLQTQTRPTLDAQTLRRLTLSERHLATIVRHSPDPIVTVTPTGGVLSWNTSAEQTWGWRASDAVGRNLADFLSYASREPFQQALRTVEHSREHLRGEFDAQTLRGGAVPLEMTIAPVLDDDDHLAAFSVIARDISVRRKAEQMEREHRANLERVVAERTAQLRETVAQLEQFSYTVSHDLRAPLRAIQGYVEILRDDFLATAPADAQAYIARVIRATERMDGLIRDVLSYSRIATANLEKQSVDMNALVAEIIAQLPEAARRTANIAIEGPLPPVTAHPALLAQALSNLVNNALKFVRPGETPQVRIWSERHGDRVRILVADRGIGIPAAFHARIFGMFERGVTSDAYQGTGIGLAIVKKSVERLGGNVGFTSTEGEGSTFWIDLPNENAPGDAPSSPTGTS